MIARWIVAGSMTLCLGASCDLATDEVTGQSTGELKQMCFVLCIEGYHQAPNACVCIPDQGRTCDILGKCPSGYRWDENKCGCLPLLEECGARTCAPGQTCCNPDCGICIGPLEGCPAIGCEPKPKQIPCGTATCNAAAEFCCSESCGICTPKRGVCLMMICEPVP